jgi:hypothetical protein
MMMKAPPSRKYEVDKADLLLAGEAMLKNVTDVAQYLELKDVIAKTRRVRTIDYRCDNRCFRLSANDCQVPTPTSHNLEVETANSDFWS